MRILLIVGVFISLIEQSFAQTNYVFKTLNNENGLTDNYVEQVLEDSRGFIWIGTHGGLNRFDGHSIKTIKIPESKDTKGYDVARNYISCLAEDEKGNIWIGTFIGVYVYDVTSDSFTHYMNNPQDGNSLSNNFTEQIIFDKSGNAWIGTRNGLTKFNRKLNIFTQYFNHPFDPQSIAGNYIYSLFVDDQNNVWVGTRNNGLDKINPNKETFTHVGSQSGINSLLIRSIYEDKNKDLWVLTAQDGLFYRRKGNTTFEKIKLFGNQAKENAVVFSNLNEDIYGNLWIGTYTDGIIIYNKSNKSTLYYSENSNYPHNLCGNSVDFITRGKTGIMWIATHGGGISMYNPIEAQYNYRFKTLFPNSLRGNIVSCFYEDSDGDVWIGTDGNGFCQYNYKTNTFTNYSKGNGLTSDAVLDIKEIAKNKLAIATWSGGLNIFDKKDKSIKQYLFQTQRNDGAIQDIYGLTLDKKNNKLWCCTYGDGIQIFDCKNIKYLTNKERRAAFYRCDTSTFNQKILIDKNNNTWIASGFYLYRISKSNNVYNYNIDDSAKKIVNCLFTNDIIQDRNGKIWTASNRGVNFYDEKKDCFYAFQHPNFDLSKARSLLEDKHGNIWIATVNALFRYSPKSNTIRNITLNWGMPEMQYFRKSAFRSRDGHLFFGGLKGFIMLHEDSSYTYNINPNLCITKLLIHNQEQQPNAVNSPISKDIIFYKTLTLNYDQSYLTLEYAALSNIDNQKIHFKYKLEGFDKEWIDAGNEHKANYTNISPGIYTFKLMCTNSDGEWSKKQYSMQIIILPPWWKTLWFKTLVAFIIISLLVLYVLYRERSIKNRNKELEKLVNEKTKELQNSNETLITQKNTIYDNYLTLREKQLLIEIKNKQLQEALNSKDKLLTVIAHDFRNPLTTLHGIAKVLKEKVVAKNLFDLQKNVDSITNSADKILSLMNEVLEWSMSKDDMAKYQPEQANLSILMTDTISLVNETALQKGIQIETDYKLESNAVVDPRMISTVFRNLIINSLKFTPKGGTIKISLSETDTELIVKISDTGNGMEQEQIEAILTDKNLLSSDYRSGFGLQLCKSFIKKNKGSLSIESQLQQGSTFTVILPKGSKMEKAVSNINAMYNSDNLDFSSMFDENQTMLIVDDNPEITNYLREVFVDSFTILEAFNGQEALEVALKNLPEIILSDINMPLMDGKKLCHQLKSNDLTSHIPIILISAQALDQDQIDGLMHGADDYITKPFNPFVLKQKVATLLQNRERLAAHFKNATTSPSEGFNLPESINDKLMAKITKIIMDNITNPNFVVEDLALEVGMSRSQLYRKTKAVLGLSPIDYIKNLKFQKAMEMLKTGKYRISEIAYELGFSDTRYFSSSFTKKYGVTPSSFLPKNSTDSQQ